VSGRVRGVWVTKGMGRGSPDSGRWRIFAQEEFKKPPFACAHCSLVKGPKCRVRKKQLNPLGPAGPLPLGKETFA
jgi:hypothetical protein